jgi:anaerobic selenocysteine-containing dehydrogenase
MLFNYGEFLASLDKKAYHEGEWQWEEDGYTVTRTYPWSGPGCHNSCGVLYYTKDGKLEKIEGDPLDPQANGRLCMRCLDMAEAVYHKDRPKYPLKRVGERGENKWERISWNEALDIIEDYINKLLERGYGRESILVNHGTGRNISSWVPFLGGACLGTPNVGGPGFSGYSCYLPRAVGTAAILGDFPVVDTSQTHPDRYDDPEWLPPDVILVWGNEPLKSNADAFLGHWLVSCVQQGSKIISIDPQLTWWGARAEYWLPLRPGTDCALGLAWLNVITQEDLIDHDFVNYWCAYYDELKEYVTEFTPAWAAEICQIDEQLIIDSARFYAKAERGAMQWGVAVDMQKCSMHLVTVLSDLIAICGNVDKPGTNILVRNAFEVNPGYATAQLYVDPDDWAKKLTIETLGIGKPFIGIADPDAVQIALESGQPYEIKMAWIQSSNPIACQAQGAPRDYLNYGSCEFVVVADPVMTPTAVAFADIFLPIKMSCERDSVRAWWSPLRALKGVVEYYEAKSDEELIIALGNRLNPKLFSWRWPTVETLLQDTLDVGLNVMDENGQGYKSAGRSKTGMIPVDDVHTDFYKVHKDSGDGDFMELVKRGGHEYDAFCHTYYKYEKGMLRPDGLVGFNTPTGRVELIPYITYQAWGVPPLPIHRESLTSEKWFSDPAFRAEYPFICINGVRSYEFFHSEHRNLKTMREFHPDPLVRIAASVCEEYGLIDGDWVWLENGEGRCRQRVKTDNTINPNFVSAEHGWWFPESDGAEPNLFGTFDSNINNLTHNQETGYGGVGSPIKSICCKIYKYQEGDEMPGHVVTREGGFKTWKPGEPF